MYYPPGIRGTGDPGRGGGGPMGRQPEWPGKVGGGPDIGPSPFGHAGPFLPAGTATKPTEGGSVLGNIGPGTGGRYGGYNPGGAGSVATTMGRSRTPDAGKNRQAAQKGAGGSVLGNIGPGTGGRYGGYNPGGGKPGGGGGYSAPPSWFQPDPGSQWVQDLSSSMTSANDSRWMDMFNQLQQMFQSIYRPQMPMMGGYGMPSPYGYGGMGGYGMPSPYGYGGMGGYGMPPYYGSYGGYGGGYANPYGGALGNIGAGMGGRYGGWNPGGALPQYPLGGGSAGSALIQKLPPGGGLGSVGPGVGGRYGGWNPGGK